MEDDENPETLGSIKRETSSKSKRKEKTTLSAKGRRGNAVQGTSYMKFGF